MKNVEGALGNSVMRMRNFDPGLVESVFTKVDMSWSKGACAKFEVSKLGDLSLIRSKHSATNSKSRRLSRHMSEEGQDFYFICIPLSGGVEVSYLGRNRSLDRVCDVGSNHLVLLSNREEYEIAMSDNLEAIWLRIPPKLLGAHVMRVDDFLRHPLDVERGLGGIVRQMMIGGASEETRLSRNGARIFSQSLMGFLGEFVNSSFCVENKSVPIGRRKILGRAREFIEENIHDDELDPLKIAQGVGISQRYLSEIFAAEGVSPMRWVRKRRLELCRAELEQRNAHANLICEVAYSMGFTNVSSFNRAFKAQFGCTPRDIQAQALK